MLLTTCKNCKKKFKISQSQLEVAKGFVRCGKCYAVFQAKDNLERIDEENQQQSSADNKANTKLPPRNPNRTLAENHKPHHFNSFKEAEDLIEAEKKSLAANSQLAKDEQISAEQSLSQNNQQVAEDSSETGFFFSGLFTKSAKKKRKKNREIAAEEQSQDVDNIDKNSDDNQPLETEIDFKAEIDLAEQAAQRSINTNENISVEEKSAEEVEEVIKQINAQASPDSIMPVSVNEQAAQLGPQYYPPHYESEKASRSELNWTIASIVALIVLIMQMFYLILTT